MRSRSIAGPKGEEGAEGGAHGEGEPEGGDQGLDRLGPQFDLAADPDVVLVLCRSTRPPAAAKAAQRAGSYIQSSRAEALLSTMMADSETGLGGKYRA